MGYPSLMMKMVSACIWKAAARGASIRLFLFPPSLTYLALRFQHRQLCKLRKRVADGQFLLSSRVVLQHLLAVIRIVRGDEFVGLLFGGGLGDDKLRLEEVNVIVKENQIEERAIVQLFEPSSLVRS